MDILSLTYDNSWYGISLQWTGLFPAPTVASPGVTCYLKLSHFDL